MVTIFGHAVWRWPGRHILRVSVLVELSRKAAAKGRNGAKILRGRENLDKLGLSFMYGAQDERKTCFNRFNW
jgi:hypothetical protein